MKCFKTHDTENAILYVTVEEHHPRYDKRKRTWSCDCDEFSLDGWLKHCKHINKSKYLKNKYG